MVNTAEQKTGGGESKTVWMPGSLLTDFKDIHSKLGKSGVTLNQLIADAIAAGLPAVRKKYLGKNGAKESGHFSLLTEMRACLAKLPREFGLAEMLDALKVARPDKAEEINRSSVSTYLRRLVTSGSLTKNRANPPEPQVYRQVKKK